MSACIFRSHSQPGQDGDRQFAPGPVVAKGADATVDFLSGGGLADVV